VEKLPRACFRPMEKNHIVSSFGTMTASYLIAAAVHVLLRWNYGPSYGMSFDTIVIFSVMSYVNAIIGYLSCVWLGDENWLKTKIDSVFFSFTASVKRGLHCVFCCLCLRAGYRASYDRVDLEHRSRYGDSGTDAPA
jgi:hypothetical protein